MKKMKIVKLLLFVVLLVYAIVTLVNQQVTLNRYSSDQAKLNQQIEEQTEYKDSLVATKDNVDSLDFIEQMAREKLGMYLPNERVYVDTGM